MQNADLTKKREHYQKLENYKLESIYFQKAYIKIEKNKKFGDAEIQKQKFHQDKGPISIKKLQKIIKQQYLIRSLLVKKYRKD